MSTVLQWSDCQSGDRSLEADVVVVGTGAGGAAVAAELAEGGSRVVMVEEGSLFRTEDFTSDTPEMMRKTYRDMGSTFILGPPHIPYVEGRCVGGSTTINGGMSFRTPERILHSWATTHGMPSLGPEPMDRWFSKVERRISVATQIPESVGQDSMMMRKGADELGWEWRENTRNQVACVGTNNCAFGCPTGAKQSSLVSYVPRALAAGATLVTDCRVREITIESGRVAGVVGWITDPRTRRRTRNKVVVRAPCVVLSCGAVHTPVLLLQQRLANRSRMVGRNFLCHPNAKVVGVFPHAVQGWKGVSQGQQVMEFTDDGIFMAENFIPPAMMAMTMLKVGNAAFEDMKRYNEVVTAACLLEDSGAGRIRAMPFRSGPFLRYSFSKKDTERAKRGVARLAELLFAAGAERVYLPFAKVHALDSPAQVGRIADAQIKPGDVELFTVHLMGTARMGTDPAASVVDEWGAAHDVPGLYIADASVFPTAIGTNPQVTIMALATRTAHHILQRAS